MKSVLDACVLYPTVLREILADVADAGLFQPIWSERILEEWRRAADRHGVSAGVEIALLQARFPQAMTQGSGGAEGLDLPDPADRHVLETALAANATQIVTANLRDFPRGTLAAVGLQAIHPDEFLRDIYLASPEPVIAAIEATEIRAQQAGSRMSRKELMRRARLPRLAKAMDRLAGSGSAPRTGA
ncbi:RSP_2648 family PIN domain-containing protein [Paracoccus aestuariivivens]|uniref:PIN domain-containing protein n=1 Tax=Paracoccus aestuariivivens TaxID=1820333 RepID=A0A6L6JFL0_9RHOB|nr:PIN domain-containing protein [Paracoccus aestuariivivens]MTH78681.1 PIN domain-containing protein [Paracoccus aestuariivivens]